ncbi:hypothetical protein JOC54_003549 [Alkalihalobacillus xiaoxiensis]|uniref:Uncharacterized protein n=1 Tax=Shouchella xiaoxiensis TaxID=766895 RepID=A0ABS2SXQ9_9BACI|nr:hypothetical protein [Shouchella xiaoxiensis]
MKKYIIAFIAVVLLAATPYSFNAEDSPIETRGKGGYDQT